MDLRVLQVVNHLSRMLMEVVGLSGPFFTIFSPWEVVCTQQHLYLLITFLCDKWRSGRRYKNKKGMFRNSPHKMHLSAHINHVSIIIPQCTCESIGCGCTDLVEYPEPPLAVWWRFIAYFLFLEKIGWNKLLEINRVVMLTIYLGKHLSRPVYYLYDTSTHQDPRSNDTSACFFIRMTGQHDLTITFRQ